MQRWTLQESLTNMPQNISFSVVWASIESDKLTYHILHTLTKTQDPDVLWHIHHLE